MRLTVGVAVPSPFPGMDPYLEGSLWMTVHMQLSVEVARQLALRLRPRYFAMTTERIVCEAPHVTVEIRDAAQRRLVTAIEVLSPTNKRGEGYAEYLAKRRRLLLSDAHLIEIDLLRRGQRLPMQEPLPSGAYFVFLSRAEERPLIDVWPLRLEDPLPTVPVPLLRGDDDVPLDLGLALNSIYALLGFDLAVNYREPAEIPLTDEQAKWANARLNAAGLRTA